MYVFQDFNEVHFERHPIGICENIHGEIVDDLWSQYHKYCILRSWPHVSTALLQTNICVETYINILFYQECSFLPLADRDWHQQNIKRLYHYLEIWAQNIYVLQDFHLEWYNITYGWQLCISLYSSNVCNQLSFRYTLLQPKTSPSL